MPSLEALAEHPGIVFGAYIAALLPLAVIYALDFISEKWRPIRETRRKGYFYLFSSIIPLGFVIFYIHLQKVAKDYKEMAAAVSAAIFCIVHIMRTIWGLVQLRAFKAWNVQALSCLHAAGYKGLSHNESGSASYNYFSLATQTSDSEPHNSRVKSTVKEKLARARDWVYSMFLEARGSSRTVEVSLENDSSGIAYSSGAEISFLRDAYGFLRSVRIWMRSVYRKLNRTQYSEGHPFSSESELEAAVDNVMIVSSGLLDNEFMGAELPCRLKIQSMLPALWDSLTTRSAFSLIDHLESVNPLECSVQWMVAFLSKFGSKWLTNHHLRSEDREVIVNVESKLGLRALLLTTYDAPKCGLRSVLHPTSAFTECAKLLSKEYRVSKQSSLPFNMRGFRREWVLFESLESSIRNGIASWDNKSLHVLEPAEREAVRNISPFDLSRFAVLMDIVLENRDRNNLFGPDLFSEVMRESRCLKTFFWQIDCSSKRSTEQLLKLVSVSSRLFRRGLWKGWSRTDLVLEASIHVDNWRSLECGSDTDEVVLEHQPLTFECAKRKELLRQEMNLLNGGLIQGKTVFLGCVIESVRGFLALWSHVIAHNGEPAAAIQEDLWNPEIGKTTEAFKCSDQLRESLHVFRVDEVPDADVSSSSVRFAEEEPSLQSVKMRLLWELQTRLHEKIMPEADSEKLRMDLPRSEVLIMLFLLGFPALDIQFISDVTSLAAHLDMAEIQDETEVTIDLPDGVAGDIEQSACMGFEISPVQGPQHISVCVVLNSSNGQGKVRMISSTPGEVEKRFEWQQWKNSVMGRLAGQSEFRLSREISKEENLRSESFHSDISAPFEKVSDILSQWQGWPPFLCHISIVDEVGFINPIRKVSPDPVLQEMSKRSLKDGDMDHRTGTEEKLSVEDILFEATRARKNGRFEKAIEIYRECILEHNCSHAVHELESMIRDDLSGEDSENLCFELRHLLKRVCDKISVFNNNEAGGGENSAETLDVSFGMLARCFDLLHEKTGNDDCFEEKLRCMLEHDSEKCICIMETFLAKGRTPTEGMVWLMFLAYFRQLAQTGDATYLSHVQKSAELYCSIAHNPFALTCAFLLEKGRICGRDFHRLRNQIYLTASTEDVTRYMAASHDSGNDTIEGKFQSTAEIPTNLRKAANIYQKLCERDRWLSAKALNRCGLLHMIYPGEIFDLEKAERFLRDAIDPYNADALCNLSVLHFYFHRDRAAAMEFLERGVSHDLLAADQSRDPSEKDERDSKRSSACRDGFFSVRESSKRTNSFREFDLRSNNQTADRSEARYLASRTVFVNGRELKVWNVSDISQDPHTTSMNNMAVLLEEAGHDGVEKALRLYQRARETDGNPIALYNMAVLLITGPVPYRDVLKGNELLEELTSRIADIGHMNVLMTALVGLEKYEWEGSVSEWTAKIEELDDSMGLVKQIQADRHEELFHGE